MYAIFQNDFGHNSAGIIIHHAANMHAVDAFGRTVMIKLSYITSITDKNIVARNTAFLFGNFGVMNEKRKIAVVREINFGLSAVI